MKEVYEGKSILIEWVPLTGTTIAAAFTRSNGERMVHEPSSGFLTTVNKGADIWIFHPLNPWLDRFNR